MADGHLRRIATLIVARRGTAFLAHRAFPHYCPVADLNNLGTLPPGKPAQWRGREGLRRSVFHRFAHLATAVDSCKGEILAW